MLVVMLLLACSNPSQEAKIRDLQADNQRIRRELRDCMAAQEEPPPTNTEEQPPPNDDPCKNITLDSKTSSIAAIVSSENVSSGMNTSCDVIFEAKSDIDRWYFKSMWYDGENIQVARSSNSLSHLNAGEKAMLRIWSVNAGSAVRIDTVSD